MDAEHDVCTFDALRAIIPESPVADAKVMPRLDEHARRFIELSPFLVIASRDADGQMDVSPKGDPPGFVKVLDDGTIAIPERPGNHRCDTFTNVLGVPEVALIFLVPGEDTTLRVMGRATLTQDPDLLESMAVQGRAPKLALRVAISETFLHCGKAPKRAGLWDPAAQVAPGTVPRLGAMIHDQIAWKTGEELPISRDELSDSIDEDARSNRY
jgi:hypothetical protein